MVYTHDAWNRQVKVEFRTEDGVQEEEEEGGGEATNVTVLENQYNGLTWRIVKKADTSAPAYNGLDEMRVMIYSAGWQLLEERVDTGWSSGSMKKQGRSVQRL